MTSASAGQIPSSSDEIRTVVVAGATGFVGRHLVPALVRAGYDVRAMTRHPETYAGPCTAVRGDVPADCIIEDESPQERVWTQRMVAYAVAARFGKTVEWYDLLPPAAQAEYAEADAELRRMETQWAFMSRSMPAG